MRESFLFVSDAAFIGQCVASDLELQRAAKRVFQHAGLGCDATVVLWRTQEQPARIDRDGHTWFFELDARRKADGVALGAILARQAARCVLTTRGTIASPSPIDIELAALLLGLGPLLLADTRGPLAAGHVRSLHARVCASLRISIARTLDVPLAAASVRFQLAISWIIARLITRPLAFAPSDAHVVIRCFCARRLRVPTGSVGKTTCPACKRRRPFDGRACRAAA